MTRTWESRPRWQRRWLRFWRVNGGVVILAAVLYLVSATMLVLWVVGS